MMAADGSETKCLAHDSDDDGWNASTLANYRSAYGKDPPCTCPKPEQTRRK